MYLLIPINGNPPSSGLLGAIMFNYLKGFTVFISFWLLLAHTSYAQSENMTEEELDADRKEYISHVLEIIQGKEDLPSSELYYLPSGPGQTRFKFNR